MKKLLSVLLMVPCLAQAEFKTGNELWNDLNADNYFSKGAALGYIMGVFDNGRGIWFCPPADGGGITAGQVQDMVKNYLHQYPQVRNLSADTLIVAVMKNNWPCAAKGKGV